MSETARHAAFVWSAYGVTGFVVACLIGRAILDGLAQRRALARLSSGGRDGDASGE